MGIAKLVLSWTNDTEISDVKDSGRLPPSVPNGQRVYAVGDIHGRADLLADLHRMIQRDAESAPGTPVIIYLGDYIDRGEQNREVLEILAH